MTTCQPSPCWGVARLLSLGLLLLAFESPASGQPYPRMAEHACRSIDVRNSVGNFVKLQNCTVIEGNLKILLIDSAQPSDYENLTFPNLREITEYFLLFRVNGLRSLRELFPNLSVIRGTKLFYNYAFVVYEMLSLQELGLARLTHIMRGDVRIEKNPDLCYVETVDWELITRDPYDPPTIKGNKKIDECPDQCPDKGCPYSKKASGDRNARLCWSEKDCQKVCSTTECKSRSCKDDNSTYCCHEECLGGCNGPFPANCFACREILFQGYCSGSCPENTFKYQGRRCLSYSECKAQTKSFSNADGQNTTYYYKPFEGLCTHECPSGYMVDASNEHSCKKCPGLCPKVCVGETISNIADAQGFVGCTVIQGSLEIQISGGKNVVSELYKSLGLVQEITGYLKIVRSYPLMSLDFLGNLSLIKGQVKHDNRYSLYVLDNPNLQNLWSWGNRNRTLKIPDSKVFFHFNPKLCIEKIKELQGVIGDNQSDSQDVSPHSNGDRAACNVTKLEIEIQGIVKSAVIVRWRNVVKLVADSRELLGYIVSYKEAPANANLSFFDDHDACATDSWKVEDVPSHEGGIYFNVTHLITNLKPFTRYGLYVKTSMVAQAQFGAISDIKHFVTSPDNPSIPVELKAWSNSSSSLIVTWNPPHTPSGRVTHYVVIGEKKEDNQNFLDLRNFCAEPMRYVTSSEPDQKPKAPIDDVPVYVNSTCKVPGGKCCPCPKDKKQLEYEERKRQSEIAFENYLHNEVYVKRPTSEDDRKRRDVSGVLNHGTMFGDDNFIQYMKRSIADRHPQRETRNNSLPTLNAPLTANNKTTQNKMAQNDTGTAQDGVAFLLNQPDFDGNVTFKKTVNNTVAVLDKLLHFSEYTIKVFACHDQERNSTLKKLCSNEAIATARTKAADGADDIHQPSITATVNNQTSSSVHIKWKTPSDPNGLIVTFHIEMEKQETKSKVSHCITHKMFLEQNGYTATSLNPGNYSLKIRSTSMSGPGSWSAPIFFLIPEPSHSWGAGVIAGISVAVIFILVSVTSVTWYITKKRRLDNPANGNGVVSVNPEYFSADGVYMPDEWEVPREKITLLKELGQGSFGMVYEGIAHDLVEGKPVAPCAVKTVNESATMRERFEFLNEASVMKTFQCFHVVKLLGVVSKGQPILVVMELMANGDLKTYLRSHRLDEGNPKSQPPTLKKLMQMALEIADGMAYLSNRKYVHRDLAARNCMVADDLTVKIGDFGMTRDIYENDYYRKGGKGLLPVRWMAPESLKDGVFTSQSDVWSYGIVLWEMATLASQPYQGLTNEQVLKYVIDGHVIEQPENCPEILYYLMKQCWHYNPKMRLTFIQIIETLVDEASPRFKDCSFYHSPRDAPPPTTTSLVIGASGGYGQASTAMFDEEDEEDDEMMDSSPSTPLRSPAREMSQPLRIMTNSSAQEGGYAGGVTTSLVGSSDGSKDSRTSTCSANGTVLNGRPGMWSPLTKDTKC